MLKKLGPGVLVAAAFIGPGTVTTCTLAGAGYGYTLLWAMLLSIIGTIFLQEMAARIGIVTQSGLADAIKDNIPNSALKSLAIFIILSAIVVGNAAYEGGNIGGATLGMQALFGAAYLRWYPLIIGLLAGGLLYLGNYKIFEKILVGLVMIMSVSFLIAAILTKPDLVQIIKGMFIPTAEEGSWLTIVALVGTTVVPYNLFLHASLVSEKWNDQSDLKFARMDTIIAITLGGLVSMAIIIAAAQLKGMPVKNAADLGQALVPVYGKAAPIFIGIGLFAAGITSAITAPLAAAYVANSCFGWNAGLKDNRFRAVWALIILLGVGAMSLKIKPIQVIQFAQVANGILLPVIAIFLVWIVNNKQVMGKNKNTVFQNIFAILIILLAIGLGARGIIRVFLGW